MTQMNAEIWKQMLTSIAGVFVALALLLLVAWMFFKGAKRTQNSPWLRRAFFMGLAGIYAVSMVLGTFGVIRGKESPQILWGLPGGLALL